MTINPGPARGERWFLVSLLAAANVLYFAYRLPLWNIQAPILSTLLLGVEMFGTFMLILYVVATWELKRRVALPPPRDRRADIFVTTWNEPLQLLRQTLLAASRVRLAGTVWLLDDGCRTEMRELAEELGVAYISRSARDHAKAGNLNNALGYSSAPFIATFDADHAPAKDFLEKTLGYFDDERLSFVQTPQDYYNLDSFQHRQRGANTEIWHEQSLFYKVIQLGKDRWNAAFFCGSGAVIRREALDDIGGFAVGTLTEDIHTSIRLHKRGWRSAFHAETLALGLSPFDFDQYVSQRLRWGRGAMQVWRNEPILFGRGLTLAQRLCYLGSTVTYFEGWQKAVMFFLPSIVLLTGWLPLANAGPEFLLYFSIWFLLSVLVTERFGRGHAKSLWSEQYSVLRYFTFVRATLALVMPTDRRFVVTQKEANGYRMPLAAVMPQLCVIAFASVAMVVGSARHIRFQEIPFAAFWMNMVWAAFNIIITVQAIRFARTRSVRGEYRFAVPVPVLLARPGGPARRALAQNMSPAGMRLRLEGAGDYSVAGAVAGTLILPSGQLPFRGSTVHEIQASGDRREFGVRFVWNEPADADPLVTFLYGNSLQSDVNDPVAASRASPIFRRPDVLSLPQWLPGLLTGGGRVLACAVQADPQREAGWRVLSYEPVIQSPLLQVDSGGPSLRSFSFRLISAKAVAVGNSHVFVSTVEEVAEATGPSSAPEMRWTPDKVAC